MPKSAAELSLQVFDSNGVGVTELWKSYHQLLTQVQWWGLRSPLPPITAEPYNQQTRSITVQATMIIILRAIARLDAIVTEVQTNTAGMGSSSDDLSAQ
eukprot:12880702-Prorocentrum_lima.AAC.1